jgi:hypothetical protein
MRFTYTKVEGFEPAIIGVRLNMSKDYEDAISKMDSKSKTIRNSSLINGHYWETEIYVIGPEDMRICKNCIKADSIKKAAGEPNSKFLQMIEVWVCVEAPLCFWKEADTYRHSVKSSTSTMHRIGKYIIDETCFEPKPTNGKISSLIDVQKLEEARQKFNETHDKDIWYDLIYGLGDSWLQTRMWHFNYSTLRNICQWRLHHKQNTWSGDDNDTMENFIAWAKTLPYAQEFIFEEYK